MVSLNIRLTVLVAILFGILYALGSMIMYYGFRISGIAPQLILASVMLLVQYLVGPKIVEMMMRVRYVDKNEYPWLYDMVAELAHRAHIAMPRVCIADTHMPNAFAFGRGGRDGRVCVTKGIMNMLSREELRAVVAHEITHLKNNDVLFITLLSVIPMVMYSIFQYFMWYGRGYRNNRDSGGNYTFLIGIAAFIFYFITNLLILYASRVREYFADRGAVELGCKANVLASALYKLVYGAAKTPKEEINRVEGLKAFFLNDISKARNEIEQLAAVDADGSGTIDAFELRRLREQRVNISGTDRFMELLSTHPNMLKRIKMLSQHSN
jgi:heat shock protein HtpX